MVSLKAGGRPTEGKPRPFMQAPTRSRVKHRLTCHQEEEQDPVLEEIHGRVAGNPPGPDPAEPPLSLACGRPHHGSRALLQAWVSLPPEEQPGRCVIWLSRVTGRMTTWMLGCSALAGPEGLLTLPVTEVGMREVEWFSSSPDWEAGVHLN